MSGVNFCIGAAVTILVALLSPKGRPALLQAFFDTVQPGGPGWGAYQMSLPANLLGVAFNWILANVTLFSTIFIISSLMAGHFAASLGFASITAIAGYGLVARVFRKNPSATRR